MMLYLDLNPYFQQNRKKANERRKKNGNNFETSQFHPYGLKISLEKVKFMKPEILYFSYTINQQGKRADPKTKLNALVEYSQPLDVADVHSFLGMTSYYRRFVENYASLAQSLNNLTNL
jgi:hypothetical protein